MAGGFGMVMVGSDDFLTGISAEQFKSASLFPVSCNVYTGYIVFMYRLAACSSICAYLQITSDNLQDFMGFYKVDPSDKLGLSKLYGRVNGDRVVLQPAVTAARHHESKLG